MEVNPDLFAIPGLDAVAGSDGQPAELRFNLSRALPVTAYICPNCGRFKFMSAIMLGNVEAQQPSRPQEQPTEKEV
jgi:hypothetical protein